MIGGFIKKILELLSKTIDTLLDWLVILTYLGIIPSIVFSLVIAKAATIITDDVSNFAVAGIFTGIISEILWIYFFLYPFPKK